MNKLQYILIIVLSFCTIAESPDEYYYNAVKYFEKGDYIHAFKYVKQAIQSYEKDSPEYNSSVLVYSYILTGLGNEEFGSKLFEEYIQKKVKENPDKALLHFNYYMAYHIENKNHNKLINSFNKLDSNHYTGYKKAFYRYMEAKIYSVKDVEIYEKLEKFKKVLSLEDKTGIIKGMTYYSMGEITQIADQKNQFIESAIYSFENCNLNDINNLFLSPFERIKIQGIASSYLTLATNTFFPGDKITNLKKAKPYVEEINWSNYYLIYNKLALDLNQDIFSIYKLNNLDKIKYLKHESKSAIDSNHYRLTMSELERIYASVLNE